jgi:hypothetical protein
LLSKSPLHAWVNHPALNPVRKEEAESKFDIGTAAHALLLEGMDNACIVECDDWRTNVAKLARDEARLAGLVPLLRKEWDRVSAMCDAAKRFLAESELGITDLQTEGKSEQSLVWEEDGTWLKCRPDWMPHDLSYILDYKTTGQSANPEGIARVILNMGYDIQDSLYRRGVTRLADAMPMFVFFFQETVEPFAGSLVSLPPQFADMGDSKVDRGLSIWRDCMESGEWPAYPSRICYPDPPTWALAQEEASRLIEEEPI